MEKVTVGHGFSQRSVFKKSASAQLKMDGNGGFYIGRYEQGTGNVCKKGVELYRNITRNKAKSSRCNV